jgi:CHAD domain-containing protein
MRDNVERELKLVPGEGFKLPPLGTELPPKTFTSTYFDTPDLRLAPRGVTFRHRVEDGAGLWQLKLPREASRIELEVLGPPARPPSQLLDLLVAYLRGRELVPVARLRTRRKRRLADGAEIVDDSVAVLDGQRVTSRFRELEIELIDGDEASLERLEKALLEAGAEQGAFRPKLFRALELASPVEAPEPAAGAPPVEVLRAALAEQYERLLAHDPGTRLGDDPEHLHQLRVATRRARAFLRAARPLLDPDWASELRDELGWLGSTLGPARDLDVLLEHVRGEIEALGGADELGGLVETLEREHEKARRAAVAALSEDRYLALLDRLENLDPKLAPDATATLGELWRDEFRRTRRTFKKLDSKSRDDELHAARIKVKRARYAAELAGKELGRRGERFVDAAKELQDVLGEHQDAVVAAARVAAWTAGDPAREAAREAAAAPLMERERERREDARSLWPDAWKKLRKKARKVRT